MNPFIPPAVQKLLSKPVSFYKECQSESPQGKAPLTNIALILDCSGSMSHGKEETIAGFNTQVDVIRAGAVDAGATTYTDVQFSTEVNIRSVAGELDDLMPLTNETYIPKGNTALLDAIGSTVAALLQTDDIDSPDTATLVTTFTDGEENASRIYTAKTIKDMVQRLEATGRWTFALLGPQQTISGLAAMLAVKERNVAGYDEHSVADKSVAFSRMALANEKAMLSRKQGLKQFDGLYDVDETVK